MTRLHHRWGAPEAEIFVFKFLPWPGLEPRTSQPNGRERYHSTTAPLRIRRLTHIQFPKSVSDRIEDPGNQLSSDWSSAMSFLGPGSACGGNGREEVMRKERPSRRGGGRLYSGGRKANLAQTTAEILGVYFHIVTPTIVYAL